MKGCTVGEFIDDLLSMGGPEKEFVFRDKYYFLETMRDHTENCLVLRIEEYDNLAPIESSVLQIYYFPGQNFAECVRKFEVAKIFDGMTVYEAEQEIEVLFG